MEFLFLPQFVTAHEGIFISKKIHHQHNKIAHRTKHVLQSVINTYVRAFVRLLYRENTIYSLTQEK